MITFKRLHKLTLFVPNIKEELHFEKTLFKVKKKICTAFEYQNKRAGLKLPELNQVVFLAPNKSINFLVNNERGKRDWANIKPTSVSIEFFKKSIITA